METLPASEGTGFEDHYITCDRCAGILDRTHQFVQAMQAAARELRGTNRRTGVVGSQIC